MIWRLADGAKMMTMMYVQLEDGETNVGDNSDRRWWMRCDAKGTHAPCDGLDKLDADAAGASDLVRELRCYKRVSAAVVAMVQLRHLPPSPTLDCTICCAPMDRLPLCIQGCHMFTYKTISPNSVAGTQSVAATRRKCVL